MVVGSRQQLEGCPPSPIQRFKLAELCVALHLLHSLPLVLTSADVQWIIVSYSSW